VIATIEGVLTEVGPLMAVLEINGLGYEVLIPVTTAEKLPQLGKQAKLFTKVVYRDDSQTIYGFHNREDREFFVLLVEKVSGIGPRIALSILSKMSVQILKNAIAASDTGLLAKCPGIGKKTAERIVIELKDKVVPATPAGALAVSAGTAADTPAAYRNLQDAVAALMTLGYKASDADKSVRAVLGKIGSKATAEELIKAALG